MNTVGLLKIFLSALGRNPLAGFPEVKLYLVHETAPIEFPALIAGASLTATPDHERNYTADFNLTFTLSVPADDYSTAQVEALTEAVSARLYAAMDIAALNTYAEEIGSHVLLYSLQWANTDDVQIDDERRISQVWTFSGQAQF